jgi:membrane associated rhomboid family serine protease
VESGGLALVGEFRTIQEANEYALVVLAMNLDCWLRMEPGGGPYALYADPAFEVAIRDEFALYAAEQSAPVRKLDPPIYKSGIELALLWALVLLFVFAKQNESASVAERFCNSSLALFDHGEWWRPFTSLFLHGDLNHLLGNVLIGGIFCVLVAHTIGPLLGWILIFASGMLGNIATARLYYPEEFLSLGASTATFGALGILVGSSSYLAWRSRSFRRLTAGLVPIVAGVIMLGWWGGGGGDLNVDVSAHVCGFGAGGLLGFLTVVIRDRRREAIVSPAPPR